MSEWRSIRDSLGEVRVPRNKNSGRPNPAIAENFACQDLIRGEMIGAYATSRKPRPAVNHSSGTMDDLLAI